MMAVLLAGVACGAGCVPDGALRRVPYYRQTQVDVGLTRATDTVGFEGLGRAGGAGLRLTETNGMITKGVLLTTVGLALGVFTSPAGGSAKVEFIDREGTREKTDSLYPAYERVRVRGIKITATPPSPEAVAAWEAGNAEVTGLLAMFPMHTDLVYYPQRDDGTLHGYAVSSYLIAAPLGRYVELATGYYFQRLTAARPAMDGVGTVTRTHRGRGIPVRLTVQPASWLAVHGELFFNMLAYDDEASGERTHGARVSGSFALPMMQRVFGRVGVERNRLGREGGWGSTVDVGLRF